MPEGWGLNSGWARMVGQASELWVDCSANLDLFEQLLVETQQG